MSREVDATLLKNAENGNVEAMFQVGRYYRRGEHSAKAFEWFERAASNGHGLAMAEVAERFLLGDGVQRDHKKGKEWLYRAMIEKVSVDATVGVCEDTLLHLAAQCGAADVVDKLIAAGGDANARDSIRWTPCYVAARFGRVQVVDKLIAAGADVNAADVSRETPCYVAARHGYPQIVESLIAAGADVNIVDEKGRSPCHAAAENGHHDVVKILITAGADIEAVAKDGRTPRDCAKNDQVRAIFDDAAKSDAGVTASAFDATRLALDSARAARGRLTALDAVAPLIAESTRADGAFGTVAAICARAADFADAEREFASQQDILRAAEQLDLQVVAARNAARQQLVLAAAAILESHDAAALGALTSAGNRVASVKAALLDFQKLADADNNAGDDDCGVVEFNDWLAHAHKSAAFNCKLTERGAEQLAQSVQSLCGGASGTHGWDVVAALTRARLAAEREKRAHDELRIPRATHAAAVAALDKLRARVVQALNLVDRARLVRAAKAPSCERLQAAQASAAKIEKQIKYARADVEHPDDAESEAAAKEQLRELKAALVEAQHESTAAVVELAAHVFDFPELRLLFPKARLDDFFAADGDATALRTLGVYEDPTVIAETRHTVKRASFGGVECALKLFRLVPANQRAFVKEARRLRQLAHPNVVEVRAVFVDGATGVIEMPLYAHGDLWQWLAAAAAARSVHEKLRVLRATLCGLEHVHRMGVVHADVKPENVFVDADGVAKLGDFDVSKDDATRVTMAATFVGFSLAYAAPEIKNGRAASKPGDMYAFGLTLFDIVHGAKPIKERPVDVELLAHHEPIEGGTSLRDITRRLVDQVAANRITASDALKSPLFAPPAPGRDPGCDRRECPVCFESHWLDEGIECDAEHFVCNGDVEATAQIFCSLAPSVIAKQGALRCQEQGCAAAPWSNASLAQSLSAAQFSAYVEKLREVSENLALVEQRQRHEAELVQLQRLWRGELTRDEEVATHRRHIRDGLLCLRCPRCKSAFVIDDFDSCLAMNCASCKAAFCAWCLRDCGADAHAHVNNCARNPMRPRTVFSNAAQFEKAHRERYAEVVSEYLRTLRNEEIRAAVRGAIRRDLDDLGVVLA